MSNLVPAGTRTNVRSIVCVAAIALTAALSIRAQAAPAERKFHASRAVVERKLREVGGYPSGKLPILDGFVIPQKQSLDHYRQGYYQYSVQFHQTAPGETQIHVAAKITAWYAGANHSGSGYRVLPSNGRLEMDLLDRLELELTSHSAAGDARSNERSNEIRRTFSLPEKPSATTARGSTTGASISTMRAWRPPSRTTAAGNIADEQRVRQLHEQLTNLQEILNQQTRPDDLAAVRSSNTPILASPVEGAQVVLRADRGDEFQILELRGPWVHVRISGLSRGWIQRSQLELPGPPTQAQAADLSSSEETSFRKSREETSTFPGTWELLRGKTVKVIWVQPLGTIAPNSKLAFAKSVFHHAYTELSERDPSVSGVVVIFDSQDGGMAAATLPIIQQWVAGHLTDAAFLKQCWADPADLLKASE
jgi:hypothetical protein